MASALVLRRALEIVKGINQGWQDYVEESERYRRDGFRPHYCQHGTDMWTDFDNICGGCEDGWTAEYGLSKYETALSEAKWQFSPRRREHDLSPRQWGRMTDGQIKGRFIVAYLETLPMEERDKVQLDKDEQHAYWTYIAWLIETADRALLPF